MPGGWRHVAGKRPGMGSSGPQIIANPADYVDTPVVFRQYCCPGCWTALYSAVVPAGHTDTMTTLGRLTATPAR